MRGGTAFPSLAHCCAQDPTRTKSSGKAQILRSSAIVNLRRSTGWKTEAMPTLQPIPVTVGHGFSRSGFVRLKYFPLGSSSFPQGRRPPQPHHPQPRTDPHGPDEPAGYLAQCVSDPEERHRTGGGAAVAPVGRRGPAVHSRTVKARAAGTSVSQNAVFGQLSCFGDINVQISAADSTAYSCATRRQSRRSRCRRCGLCLSSAPVTCGDYIFGLRPAISSRQISSSAASAGFSIRDVRSSTDWLSGLPLFTSAFRSR